VIPGFRPQTRRPLRSAGLRASGAGTGRLVTGMELTPAADDDPDWEIRSCPDCGVVVLIVTRPVPDDLDAQYAVKLAAHRRRRHSPQ
jgi:hypothetical protein